MSNDELILGDIQKKWHPHMNKVMKAKFIGFYKYYPQWEFLSDGLVILGEARPR